MAAGFRYIRSAWSEWRDSNPHRKAWKARMRPLHHIRFGSAYAYRTPSASEAKRDESREAESSRNPSLHDGAVGCDLHTQAERMDRLSSPGHRHPSVVKDPTHVELVGSQGFEPKRSPRGERGYGPSADHPLVLPMFGDSARIRTRTRELWRLGCSRYTTLPTYRSSQFVVEMQFSSLTSPCFAVAVWPKTKKAFWGITPEGLLLHDCRPFRAGYPPYPTRCYGG
jgi:hypothetical protein